MLINIRIFLKFQLYCITFGDNDLSRSSAAGTIAAGRIPELVTNKRNKIFGKKNLKRCFIKTPLIKITNVAKAVNFLIFREKDTLLCQVFLSEHYLHMFRIKDGDNQKKSQYLVQVLVYNNL